MAKVNKAIVSLNAGELSPLMQSRFDQQKYGFGCRTLENFIPLIYGGAERRPGLEYIATQKSSLAKGRLVAFEHSVDDTYMLLFENQVIRVFRNGEQVVEGVGTETLTAVDGDNLVANWKLNDIAGVTITNDDDPGTYDGTSTTDASTLHATGKVGTGCFDLDGQYAVSIADAAAFSFTNNTIDSAFSIACWAYVTRQSDTQVLLSKWRNSSTTREWRFSLNNERKLQLHLADASADVSSDCVSHYKLNETAAATAVDDDIELQDGVATANTNLLTATGKTNMTPCFDFDGQYAVEINDQATHSFGNGTTDSAFSIAAWIYVTGPVSTGQDIVTKLDYTTGSEAREYAFFLNNANKLTISLYDESENAIIYARTNDALASGWNFVVVTYDGSDSEDGLTLYVNNVLVGQSAYESGTYVAMENTTTKLRIGASENWEGNLDYYFRDKIDNVMLFDVELTTAQVATLWNDGDGTENLAGAVPTPSVVSDDAISEGWHFLACTYSAVHSITSDGGSATDDMILYVDGVAVNSTATDDADYDAMVNGDEEVRIGSQYNLADNAHEKFWGDKIDEVSIFKDVLTPTEVASLYSTTPYEIETPYLTADLFDLDFKRSADVMYITHGDYEPRRLSRTGHTIWTLEETDIQDGPFRAENDTVASIITPSATTGNITLTASGTGNKPFMMGTTAGHTPSGSATTSKSVTGALFKIIHSLETGSYNAQLTNNYTSSQTENTSWLDCGIIYKGVKWYLETVGGNWVGTLEVQRNYNTAAVHDSDGWEAVFTFQSNDDRNVSTDYTEDIADAAYRVILTASGDDAEDCEVYFRISDQDHIGVVEITSVQSSTVALGTVVQTLGSTEPTSRWAEGAWSNYRGWPIAIDISPEERLTFGGNASKPLTVWGSVVGKFNSFKSGILDDDAITFTLIGSGQQNTIRWMLPKKAMMIGTIGGEHLLSASDDSEALTPTNVQAKLQTTYGSERTGAFIVNNAILFLQRGGMKIRELIYDWEQDSHTAEDLTIFAHHITESGVTDMAFQRTPDPTLWCVRTDGEIAVLSYERDQNVFAWSRIVTADGTSDSDFESVAIIYGGAGEEDEVWTTVKRTIGDDTVRYIERFKPRSWGDDIEDAFFVDSGLTYDSVTAASTITGLSHLAGETVAVWADGVAFDDAVVTAGGEITLKLATETTTANVAQVGLAYDPILIPMRLDLEGLGLATTKKIPRVIIDLYKTMYGNCGTTEANVTPLVYRDASDTTNDEFPLHTGFVTHAPRGGYNRNGDIVITQDKPAPMTVLSLTFDIGAYND